MVSSRLWIHEMKLSDKEVKLISSNIHRIEDILNTYVP
jgi:hypothetical protein